MPLRLASVCSPRRLGWDVSLRPRRQLCAALLAFLWQHSSTRIGMAHSRDVEGEQRRRRAGRVQRGDGRSRRLRPLAVGKARAPSAAPPIHDSKGPGFLDALVGIALDGSPWEYMLSLRAKGYDGCVRVPLGPAGDFYFLLSPDAVKHVCVEAADEWPRRFSVPLFETLALDRGIVYEQGSRHKRQKKLCTPVFERGAAMASFLQAISLESDALAARWRCLNRLDLYAETRTLTLRVVLRVTFGLEPDDADAELSDADASYLEAIVATGERGAIADQRQPAAEQETSG